MDPIYYGYLTRVNLYYRDNKHQRRDSPASWQRNLRRSF